METCFMMQNSTTANFDALFLVCWVTISTYTEKYINSIYIICTNPSTDGGHWRSFVKELIHQSLMDKCPVVKTFMNSFSLARASSWTNCPVGDHLRCINLYVIGNAWMTNDEIIRYIPSTETREIWYQWYKNQLRKIVIWRNLLLLATCRWLRQISQSVTHGYSELYNLSHLATRLN